ncbi:hypothetical protein BOTCAL_0115g00160 [Botryotinia calthae]|uniref:Cystathionine beta-lyase n=1 Tax=Botryotinia calthae TaxID=38488 RepID=A0A4Y8D7C8_9HELO|nr:hypothetical protein BOTCAL_0115g00160 [Botryotinia calthae]
MSSPSGSSQASGAGKANGALNKAFPHIDLDGHNLPPSPAPSSPHNGRRYALATELVYTETKDQYGASSMPIYQSATFKQNLAGGGSEYDYTRSGNPTRTHLERHLAKIMNANRALVVGSGMGALDVITRVLRPGDEVITGDDLYGGTNRLLTYLAANTGIIVHHVDTTTPDKVKAVLGPKTAMVLLETPTNPLIKIVDIATIARTAHELNEKALVVVDNTMLSPMLCNPLDLGADIVYESGTKYLSGHHDIMAGVLAFNDPAIGDKMYFTINSTGCGLSPNDSFLLMRGIKTLAIRMERQQTNAQAIAEFLETHGFRVRYPGLKSHPQYDLHWSMARGAGAVLSFETGDVALSERIVEAAKLWGISVSFGCVNSLISMPCQMSHASIDAKTRKERQMPEDIIRLCVGIEDVNDLIDDLSRALVQAGAVKVTLDGFHAIDAAQTIAEVPIAESDAAAAPLFGFVYEGKARVKVEDSMLFVSGYGEHPLQRHIASLALRIRVFGSDIPYCATPRVGPEGNYSILACQGHKPYGRSDINLVYKGQTTVGHLPRYLGADGIVTYATHTPTMSSLTAPSTANHSSFGLEGAPAQVSSTFSQKPSSICHSRPYRNRISNMSAVPEAAIVAGTIADLDMMPLEELVGRKTSNGRLCGSAPRGSRPSRKFQFEDMLFKRFIDPEIVQWTFKGD